MAKLSLKDHAKEAAIARSDLNIPYGVIALLEGGTISSDCYPTTRSIIRQCKSRSGLCLKKYDRHIAAIAKAHPITEQGEEA